MKRFLLVLPFASLLLACPEAEVTCGELDSVPVDSCSASQLATLERAGIWHGLAQDEDSERRWVTVTAFHDPATPRLEGRAVDEGGVDFDGRFFIRSTYANANGQSERHAYYGCNAPDPRTLTGTFQVCINGEERDRGNFEMKRITRLSGEEESSGLTFQGEARLTQGTPLDVFVSNGKAYVASGQGGLNVFDVSNPTSPQLVHQFNKPDDYFYDVTVHGDVLYVASHRNGLLYFDLLDNPLPTLEIGRQPSPVEAIRSIYVDPVANRLVANSIDSGQVLLFNIANPRSPVLLGRFTAAEVGTSNYPHQSVLEGDLLYGVYGAEGVVAASVSQPSAPTQLGNAASPLEPARNSHSLALSIVETVPWVYEVGEGWGGHVRTLNFSSATAPVPAGEFVTRTEVSANQVERFGNRLYLAYHQDGVRVLDISNPAAPTQVAYFNAWSDTALTRGNFFYEGVTAVHAARDGSGRVYALETERGLIILDETP